MTLRDFALGALAAGDAPESSYLQERRQATAGVTLDGYLHNPDPVDQPLLRLRDELTLTIPDLLAVAVAAAVEEEVMAGRAIARLQAPLGGSRPTLGLLAEAFHCPIRDLASGAAIATGLLTLPAEGPPLPERVVSIPAPTCFALRGVATPWPGSTIGLGPHTEVPLPASVTQEAARQATALTGTSRALVIRTASAPEGRSVAARIAASMGLRPAFLENPAAHGLEPWLSLLGLLPVFCLDLAPGDRKELPAIPGRQGPVVALCGPDGSVETAAGSTWNWQLDAPTREERLDLWRQALNTPPGHPLAAQLAADHRHRAGRIAQLGHIAIHCASLRNADSPGPEDVAAAAAARGASGLDALAQALPHVITGEALITTPALRKELDALVLRCRARDGLVHGLGASAQARYQPGVRALFVGPSGTGKTLAAGWIAGQLGMPLYRVDLASVTSKYIGETEKNLAQLLARAEHAEVVLLFDEADSLFGKRTDIRDSNDRFANAQTNYLLQRMESFDGITLLTSNSRSRFDSAFSRRLDMVIDFPLPGPEERRRLWQSHLGAMHTLSETQLNQLAVLADIGGGNIRNVVLAAAAPAQRAARKIAFADIAGALDAEFRKLGKQRPAELIRP